MTDPDDKGDKDDPLAQKKAEADAIMRKLQRAERRAALQRARWGEGGASALTHLAQGFPELRDAAGIDPFDPDALTAWASSGKVSPAAHHAARFVLQVAGHGGMGGFDVVDAMREWDDEHRAACLAWLEAPFWA